MSLRRGRLQADPRPKPAGKVGSVHRLPISKASPEQAAKCHDRPCVVCGRMPFEGQSSDAMHLAARGFRGGCSSPDCTVPGCRWCHRDHEDGKLDLSVHVSGPAFVVELQHMLGHYEGDWVAMGERLTRGRVLIEGAGGE